MQLRVDKFRHEEAEFINQLYDTSKEVRLPAVDYFQRACLRELVDHYVYRAQESPSENDMLVVTEVGLYVANNVTDVKNLDGAVIISFIGNPMATSIRGQEPNIDPGIILRRCITISWDICKHIAWATSESEFLEFCNIYKDVQLNGNFANYDPAFLNALNSKLRICRDSINDIQSKKLNEKQIEFALRKMRNGFLLRAALFVVAPLVIFILLVLH